MVLKALLHLVVQLVDVLEQQLLFDVAKVAQSCVVASQKLVQAIDVHHIVLLLKGDVDDGVRDFITDAVQELSLTDDDAQSRVKIDLVATSLRVLLQN